MLRCGHCKSLAPEYATTAKLLADVVPLAKVDCTMHKELSKRFEIQGYPTLKLFKADSFEPINYDGGRDSSSKLYIF